MDVDDAGVLRCRCSQTQGFIQSLLDLMQLELATPDYSTLSRRQGNLAVVVADSVPR